MVQPSIEEMVRRLVSSQRVQRPTWSPQELRNIEQVRGALRALPPSATSDALFQTLRSCFPFEAGMVETFYASRPTEVVDSIFHVPEAFISTRSRLIEADPAIPVVSRLPVGCVGRSLDVFSEAAFRSLPYSQALYPRFGFAHVTGFAISSTPRGNDREHVTLWFFHELNGRVPTWRECRLLELLHEETRAALARMRLPLLAGEPIRYQILQEQRVGTLLLRPGGGKLLELNRRAALLACSYMGAAPVRPWRAVLRALSRQVLSTSATPGYSVRYLKNRSNACTLEVSTHALAKEQHALGEDVILVELREHPSALPPSDYPLLWELPPRQREVARLLVGSGLSSKEIAHQLGLSEGTIRKHTERIYRTFNVHSRPEFMAVLGRR
jgi:DNA-binding CsgD family transcriptional regulator